MSDKMTKVEIKEEVLNRFYVAEKTKYNRFYCIRETSSGKMVSVRGKVLRSVSINKISKELWKLRKGLESQLLIENGYEEM